MAWPLASVTPPFRKANVAKLWLPISANVTVCPAEGAPEPSVTVALIMVLSPAFREVASAVKVMMSPVDVAELDNRVIMITPRAPVTLAWIVSWTLVVGLFIPAL
jgi:hypothetical protein